MAAGYEARARITADVSGFVAGARSIASASNAASAAVRSLTTQLLMNQRAATQAAANMRTFSQAASGVARNQQQSAQAASQAAQSASQMAQAYNQGAAAAQRAGQAHNNTAQAQNTVSRSAASLGREMETVAGKLAVLERIQASGTRLNREQAEAMNTLRGRAGELQRQYGNLSDEGRQTADAARAMERANSTVRSSLSGLTRDVREQVSEQRRAAQASQVTSKQLDSMGQTIARLQVRHDRFQASQRAGVQLNQQEAASAARVEAQLRSLWREWINLDRAQRQQVITSRDLALANRSAADAMSRQSAMQTQLARTGSLTHSQMRELSREMDRVREATRNVTAAAVAAGGATNEQRAALRTLRTEASAAHTTFRALSNEQRATVQQMRAGAAAASEAARAKRDLAAGARDAQGNLRGMDQSLWSLRSALGDLQGFLNQTTSMFRRAASELATTFSEQEMAIAHISRVTQATMQEMDTLTAGIRELATVIPLPFQELGHIARLGAQVGIANDAVVNFTETVALFAATTDVTSEAASTMFARIQQMTDIDDTQFRNLGASVSELGSNSAATENEILTVIESISTMADQAGMTGESIIGLGAAMASLRIRPEIARGATQRVFLQLSSAVEEAGGSMEEMVRITGLTGDELQNLASSDYDQFFMRVMEGLSGAYEAGEPLVPLLRSLGIQNSRDAEVIARLAANYDILRNSMDMAHESFAAGTYLQREADRIFQTLTAQVQIMANAWDQFKFAAVAAIAPFISIVVSGATAVMEFVGQNELLVAVLGRYLIVAAVVAGFAALAAVISGLIQAWIALRTLLATTVVTMGLMSTTAASSATTMGLLAGAARGAAVSLGSAAASAGVAGVAMGALGVAMRLLAPLAVITAIMGAVQAIKSLTQSATDAQRAHLDAAGGVETLKQAMIDDTEAAINSKDALVFRRQSLEEMTDEELKAAEASRTLTGNQRGLSQELNTSTNAMSAMGDAAQAGTGAYTELGAEAAAAGVAIGEANQAFAAAAVESVITESGVLRSREAFQMLRGELEQFGGLGGLIEMELTKAGSASEALSELWWDLADSMGAFERLGADVTSLLNSMTGGFIDLRGDSALALDAIKALEGGFEGISEAQIEAINSMELFQGELEIAEDGTVQFKGGLDELAGGLEGVEDAADGGAEAMANFAEGVGQAFGALSELGQGLEDEEKNLANYTQQLEDMMRARVDFATNLMALQGRVSDETLALMAQNAEQFAPILEELASSGDDVVENFEDMLSFIEGELNERYTAAMEELVDIAANSAEDAVTEQLDALNKLWEDGQIGPREYVEELEALLEATTNGFSGATQEQVDALTNMFDGTKSSAQEMADGLIDMFDGAGDITSMMLAEQLRILKGHLDDGTIDVAEFVENVVGILTDGDYTFEPELDGDEALRETGELADNIELTAADTEAIFTPAVEREPSEIDMDALSDYIELLANQTLPVFEPETDGSQAERDMGTTRTNIESSASSSTPTFRARTDGSQAQTDMTGIMGTLRGMASTIWVTIRGVAGAMTSGNRRDGGWIDGKGGPRQDANLYAVSDREFVVNARDAADYAPVLEWINSQRGRGGGTMPSFVPPDIMQMPSTPLTGRSMAPESVQGAQRTRMDMRSPAMVINVNNTYPQAEPTSVTINRSLQYAELMEGAVQ